MEKNKASISKRSYKKDHLFFSIIVTGKCNLSCSYCHFYATRNREMYNFDISDDLFENYLCLIKDVMDKHFFKDIDFRFSGGEPLIIGDRIYELSKKSYNILGKKPFILTNGKLITDEVIDKSIENNVGGYVVSLENPFDIDKGSMDPLSNINKIKSYKSYINIIPGIVVIKNNMFKKLFNICDYFYNELGCIPAMSELSFSVYESPTQQQLDELYENIYKIVQKYFMKTPLRLFPYIVPELLNGKPSEGSEYLTELDINNKYNLNKDNLELTIDKIFDQIHKSYRSYNFEHFNCDWYDNCRIIKGVWFVQTNQISISQKMLDYCNLKKTISNAYYNALRDLEK